MTERTVRTVTESNPKAVGTKLTLARSVSMPGDLSGPNEDEYMCLLFSTSIAAELLLVFNLKNLVERKLLIVDNARVRTSLIVHSCILEKYLYVAIRYDTHATYTGCHRGRKPGKSRNLGRQGSFERSAIMPGVSRQVAHRNESQ